MIAYNREELANRYIQQQAREALEAGCISNEENSGINAAHPVHFYTPNIFICTGLLLLTCFITLCSLGLLMLMTMNGGDSLIPQLLFCGLTSYAALEFIIYKRRHYRSGVDLGLIWMSALFIYLTIYSGNFSVSATSANLFLLFIGMIFAIRFANNSMTVVAYVALLMLTLSIVREYGRTGRIIAPFLLMIISLLIFIIVNQIKKIDRVWHYRQCFTTLKVVTLLSFYASGNYYVVRELSNYLFGTSPIAEAGLPMGWFFWCFTFTIPFLYVVYGIRKKNYIFLWIGLALNICTILTFRYYHPILPVEWAMILGGIISIVIAYGLIKYLKVPRYGFSALESNKKHLLENLQIESLVIAGTLREVAKAPPTQNEFKFGGGSGGGSGAGGSY